MAKFSRLEVLIKMKETGVVPLFYHPDVDHSKKVLKACYDGGARVLEFTSRGNMAHEVFAELVKYAKYELSEMAVGVGSVTDQGAASLYMQLGANFVVTPVLREDIALICNRRKVLWSPGCGSLTEIARAEELGCELVKLFPGGTYGPKFIKAILGPQPWTSIMPTGGVQPTEESMGDWINAGAFCLGMGSQLISRENIEQQNFEVLTSNVAKAIGIYKKLRSK